MSRAVAVALAKIPGDRAQVPVEVVRPPLASAIAVTRQPSAACLQSRSAAGRLLLERPGFIEATGILLPSYASPS